MICVWIQPHTVWLQVTVNQPVSQSKSTCTYPCMYPRMHCWGQARDQVSWFKPSRRVQPDKRDLGRSGPRCLPTTSTSYLHSLKPSRLTPSDLSSLIRSKQEDWRQRDFTGKIQKRHSLGSKQTGADLLSLTPNYHNNYYVIKLITYFKRKINLGCILLFYQQHNKMSRVVDLP